MTDDRNALKARFGGFASPSGQQAVPQSSQPVAHTTDVMSPNEPVMRRGFDEIKLKVRRNQKSTGFSGNVSFSVHFIAELSPDAKKAVARYRFGGAILYQKDIVQKFTKNPIVALWRLLKLFFTRSKWRITVNDLVQGRTITCKDILEVLEVEDDVRSSAEIFARILRTASWFGGEELIDL